MSVEIDPQELGFRRPFTVEVSEILKITNPNPIPVAFKVKTTAPKQYCVRPNSGRIEANHDVEVSVLLQAMKQDPPLDAKCRDKFLVQSVPITMDRESISVHEIWESVPKAEIQEKKIRVVFLPAEGSEKSGPSAITPKRHSIANGVDTPDAPPAYSSPREPDTSVMNNHPGPDQSSPETKSETKSNLQESPSIVSSVIPSAVKDSETVEVLKAKLAAVEAKLAEYTSAAGLRQRKGAGASGEDVAGAVPQLQEAIRQGTEGVPVRVAAVLCLISFLLAYLFF